MHYMSHSLYVQSQLHFQSHSMNGQVYWAVVTFCCEISSRRLTWQSDIRQSSLWVCQKQPQGSVLGCDTARYTQDSHIEGEDSTTCLESESWTTLSFQLFVNGNCLSHQIPRAYHQAGFGTTLWLAHLSHFPLRVKRLPSYMMYARSWTSHGDKQVIAAEGGKWPFLLSGFFRPSALAWHLHIFCNGHLVSFPNWKKITFQWPNNVKFGLLNFLFVKKHTSFQIIFVSIDMKNQSTQAYLS